VEGAGAVRNRAMSAVFDMIKKEVGDGKGAADEHDGEEDDGANGDDALDDEDFDGEEVLQRASQSAARTSVSAATQGARAPAPV
jgi:hypothetical protein